MNRINCSSIKITKSNGPSKVYKEMYIPPDGKHKGFYRRYLVNVDSEKFAKVAARAAAGGALSKVYKLYLNFVKMLEDHRIPNRPRESHNRLMNYKAKLIKAVALAKAKRPPVPVFAFSDYTERRLQESRIITTVDWETTNGERRRITGRSLQYPGEHDTPEFDLDPKDEVVEFMNKNLVEPLKSLSGTIKDCRGLDLEITAVNKRHCYQRAEFRISQYIHQYITEKHYHDLRMVLGYDVRDPDTPADVKAEFEKSRDVFEQHIQDDIDANADAMAKELCEGLVDTVKNPLWLKEGNNSKQFGDPLKEGTTEFHSKDFTVLVAHSGTIMTFWPNSAGERFAIEQGWRGATQNPSSDNSDDLKSIWTSSAQSYHDFLRNFDRRNFAVGYYPQQSGLKSKIFRDIRYSHKPIDYSDNYFIKRSQYEQYITRQLLEIANHHNIKVPESSSPDQIIAALISNTAGDVGLDLRGEYKIPDMMQYDALVFTDYDFAELQPRRQSNDSHSPSNNRRPSQDSRNSRRNAESSGRNPSIGERGMSALLALRSALSP